MTWEEESDDCARAEAAKKRGAVMNLAATILKMTFVGDIVGWSSTGNEICIAKTKAPNERGEVQVRKWGWGEREEKGNLSRRAGGWNLCIAEGCRVEFKPRTAAPSTRRAKETRNPLSSRNIKAFSRGKKGKDGIPWYGMGGQGLHATLRST